MDATSTFPGDQRPHLAAGETEAQGGKTYLRLPLPWGRRAGLTQAPALEPVRLGLESHSATFSIHVQPA